MIYVHSARSGSPAGSQSPVQRGDCAGPCARTGWRSRKPWLGGELDLLMQTGDGTVVFVEVRAPQRQRWRSHQHGCVQTRAAWCWPRAIAPGSQAAKQPSSQAAIVHAKIAKKRSMLRLLGCHNPQASWVKPCISAASALRRLRRTGRNSTSRGTAGACCRSSPRAGSDVTEHGQFKHPRLAQSCGASCGGFARWWPLRHGHHFDPSGLSRPKSAAASRCAG